MSRVAMLSLMSVLTRTADFGPRTSDPRTLGPLDLGWTLDPWTLEPSDRVTFFVSS